MRISDIFKYRNTEPVIIITLRVFILLVFLIALIAYLIILIMNMASDQPLLQISSYQVTEVPMPGMNAY